MSNDLGQAIFSRVFDLKGTGVPHAFFIGGARRGRHTINARCERTKIYMWHLYNPL